MITGNVRMSDREQGIQEGLAIGRTESRGRIEELEAALTSIRDLLPVELSPGLISSPEELARDMQIIANRALVQEESQND